MREAPGRPGIPPSWTTSAKIGVGTAMSKDSKTWFTLSHGILNEIYWPRIDIANLRDFGFIVTGDNFFSEERRHTVHDYETLGKGIPAYLLTNTCKEGRFKIEKKIIVDPKRDVILQEVTFTPLIGTLSDYRLYALAAPHLANGGMGNNAFSGDYKGIPMLFATKNNGPALAIAANVPFLKTSVGYVGVSDGWQELSKNFELKNEYDSAPEGNIALTGEIDLAACKGKFVIALGLGHRLEEAGIQVRASLFRGFDAALEEYINGWRTVQSQAVDLSHVDNVAGSIFRISIAVLKTHQGKQFTGSLIASLSIPWGTHRGDHDLGGYHLIWPRDQVETADAFLAVNDLESAKQILIFLLSTQEADGHWPQNMWDDGKSYWSKVQLDETALPIFLAGQLKKANYLKRLNPYMMVKKGVSYLLNNGPITEQDRWEEAHGLTPYTLAVLISSFLIAADFCEDEDDTVCSEYIREAADWWNYCIERWLYVKDTPLSKQIGVEGYYIRINPSCSAIESPINLKVTIANRPMHEAVYPAWYIISCDALALVRFGLRDAKDPKILNTIKVIDAVLKTETPRGPVWHRYNEDGYGEKPDGSAFDGTGIGRGWPLLTGERAHYEIAAGNLDRARELLRIMASMAGTGGLFPEQVWDQGDIPEHALFKGHSTGAAKPLVWTHSEYIRLLRSLQDEKVFSTPIQTTERYLKKKVKPKVALWQLKAQFSSIPKGLKLRIQLPHASRLKFSKDGWKTHEEVDLKPNGFGGWYKDFEMPSQFEFTIFWLDENRWEEKNYSIGVDDK